MRPKTKNTLDTTLILDVVRFNSKFIAIITTKVDARNIKLPIPNTNLFSLVLKL